MPYATTDDGVHLYFEETGSGRPLILVHEFAGDLRSYEQQMRHFGKRYRAIAFNARGFPPSDVPEHVSSYSQDRARRLHPRCARSFRRAAGACYWTVDGWICDAPFRSASSAASAVTVHRWLRLWRRTRQA